MSDTNAPIKSPMNGKEILSLQYLAYLVNALKEGEETLEKRLRVNGIFWRFKGLAKQADNLYMTLRKNAPRGKRKPICGYSESTEVLHRDKRRRGRPHRRLYGRPANCPAGDSDDSLKSFCPYTEVGNIVAECSGRLAGDALAYIQQLEGDLSEERELNEFLGDKVKQLESRLAQVERERDAAVHDLKLVRCCGTCVNNEGGCTTECYIVSGTLTGWQWRGICTENTKEEA